MDQATVDLILDMHRAGRSPREIIEATGVSQTKVYEVLRMARARLATQSTESPDALTSDPGGATHEEGTVQSDHTSTDAGVNGKASEEEK